MDQQIRCPGCKRILKKQDKDGPYYCPSCLMGWIEIPKMETYICRKNDEVKFMFSIRKDNPEKDQIIKNFELVYGPATIVCPNWKWEE